MGSRKPSMTETVSLARRIKVARFMVKTDGYPVTRTQVAQHLGLFVDGIKPTIDAMERDGEIESKGQARRARYVITNAGREVAKLDIPGDESWRGYDHRALWDCWGMERWIPSCKEVRA